jgi:asparagine synthase (glutamine-hydrolysing)
MVSNDGRYVVTFNGEIYNFVELRGLLAHSTFRGRSDTEVLLCAIAAWGLDEALRRFRGMFAFALWDRAERRLHLVRDRVGIKPLYYGWMPNGIMFASELGAIESHADFHPEVDPRSIALLMRHKCIPAPWSIYKGVRKLEPGRVLTIADPIRRKTTSNHYWKSAGLLESHQDRKTDLSESEAEELLHEHLAEAVKAHMVADVPIGAFLSGGVDSSLIVALMQSAGSGTVKTYTVGFDHAQYDEREPAAAIACALGTNHQAVLLGDAEAVAAVPAIAAVFDEPFADSSQIPTYLVASLARTEVTVALSGDGGDEVFGGYNRHVWGPRAWQMIRRSPVWARRAGRSLAGLLDEDTWNRLLLPLRHVSKGSLTHRNPGQKLFKLLELARAESVDDVYVGLATLWSDPAAVVLSRECGTELVTAIRRQFDDMTSMDVTSAMMYLDLVTYLPNDILTKLDRATMAVGLEARVPFLDHRVVEFAWALPVSMKVRNGQGKWLLRRVLDRYLDRSLLERPKTGFGVPLGAWLRGPLRDWAEDLLDEKALQQTGLFDASVVRRYWKNLLLGRRPLEYHVWPILMTQAWLRAHPGVTRATDPTKTNSPTSVYAGSEAGPESWWSPECAYPRVGGREVE